MRTIQPEPFDVFTIEELQEASPDAFDKAWEYWKESVQDHKGDDLTSEYFDTARAVIDTLGLRIDYFEFNLFDRSYVGVSSPYDIEELFGHRAYTYLANRLIIMNDWKPISKLTPKELERRKYMRPWAKTDCPFTGFIMDDVYIEWLFKEIALDQTVTIKEALRRANARLSHACFMEYSESLSVNAFKEECAINGYEFKGNGKQFNG